MNLVWLVKANSKLLRSPFYASRKTLKLSDPTWLNDSVCFDKKVTRKTFSYHTCLYSLCRRKLRPSGKALSQWEGRCNSLRPDSYTCHHQTGGTTVSPSSRLVPYTLVSNTQSGFEVFLKIQYSELSSLNIQSCCIPAKPITSQNPHFLRWNPVKLSVGLRGIVIREKSI